MRARMEQQGRQETAAEAEDKKNGMGMGMEMARIGWGASGCGLRRPERNASSDSNSITVLTAAPTLDSLSKGSFTITKDGGRS